MDEFPLPIFPLKNRAVTLLGLGSMGGGVGAVKYLVSQGADVTVIDQAPPEKLTDSLKQLQGESIKDFYLGVEELPELESTELIVVNPAVRPDHPVWEQTREKQLTVTTEIGLFLQATPAKIIGVTGSNGKSTTAALIAAMIRQEFGRCWLGGNLGGSLLSELGEMTPEDWCVLELSSFQLHTLNRFSFAPEIAVVTNFSPNHLDWHSDLEHYRLCKQALIEHQSESQYAILNGEDSDVSKWPTAAKVKWFDSILPDSINNRLKGPHNQLNVSAAIAAVKTMGVTDRSIQLALDQFQTLPHRLEYLGEYQGRDFYNDSLATTPESAIAALNSFDQPIVLLAGGADKQVDLSLFAQEISQKTKATILMGATASKLSSALESCSDAVCYEIAESFEAAFQSAWQLSEPGEVILLSPGCASYGWFSHFRERGERFRQLFDKLKQP